MTPLKIEIHIGDRLPVAELLALQEHEHIDSLYISSDKTVTTEVTRLLKNIKSLRELIIWKEMTRTALRDCFAINNLESLHVFELANFGKNIDTSKAIHLKEVNLICSTESSAIDLGIFAKLPNLTEIKAHNSEWSAELLTRFIKKPLKLLDMEDSNLTKKMIDIIVSSKTIIDLDVGGTVLNGNGLEKITQMQQLEALDIWNTRIHTEDLTLLKNLPNLNYLSIGGYRGQKNINVEQAIPHLLNIPKLNSIWIDDLFLTDEQLALLRSHIETVQHRFDDWYE